jgi:hypothetical protein
LGKGMSGMFPNEKLIDAESKCEGARVTPSGEVSAGKNSADRGKPGKTTDEDVIRELQLPVLL